MVLAQYAIITISVLGLLFYFYRTRSYKDILLAACMTSIWVTLSGLYAYRQTNLSFLGLNLFAFFAWTAGLVLVRFVYERLGNYKFAKSVALYVISIILLEWVGYNLWGIQLVTNYPGLFGFELMHMPWYGKLYYLTAGPLYIMLWEAFKGKSFFKPRKSS